MKLKTIILTLIFFALPLNAYGQGNESRFKFNHNDKWDFTAHDKQAHFLGGMYIERALFNRLHETRGEIAHIPAVIMTIGIGLIWEIKDGYVRGLLGDDAGFSPQDFGYVAIGAVSSAVIEITISKIFGIKH